MAPRKKRTADPMEEDGGDSALVDLLKELNGDHQTSFRLSDDGLSIHLPGVVPTGAEDLDLSIGRGGVPQSRITLISGDEGCGKTTLALQLCASVQKMGGAAVYLDAEYKLDRDYAATLGVDLDRLIVVQPETMEHCFDQIELIIASVEKKSRPFVIIWDSINSLPTEAELKGSDAPGQASRAMSAGLRQVNRLISKCKIALVLISQTRVKFGVRFGKKTTTGCGNAPRFYAALIFEMIRVGAVKSNGEKIGHRTKIEVTKNQIGPPFRKAELLIRYGSGIDWANSLHEAVRTAEVVEVGKSQRCAWNGPGGPVSWQGGAELRALGDRNPEAIVAIANAFRERFGWNNAIGLSDVPRLLAVGAPLIEGKEVDAKDEDDDDGGED